jgi:glycogen debranching enzyme
MTGKLAQLWDLGSSSIRELETPHGILASGKEEIYGCLFGRDSLITSLKLLDVYACTEDTYYLALVRKVLTNLAALQGNDVNIESGEEPGKIIHEYRPDRHEHLTTQGAPPWYVYPDGVMRNYDTADATPLFLMVAHAYVRVSGDTAFIEELLPSIRAGLDWMRCYGDSNNDGLFDYRFHPERSCGGLRTQSWMDSHDSVFFEESDVEPRYPIAPVEVQAYAYVAYRAWADFFLTRDADLSGDLSARADALKRAFNGAYPIRGKRGRMELAFAIDGDGRQLASARSSMGHCLFAAWEPGPGAMPESVLDAEYVPAIARRLMAPDLYAAQAGIRTLSMRSRRYDPNSYHNGSIWPHDTAIVAEGLEKFGFREEAKRMRRGLMRAYAHFNTPLELFVFSGGKYQEYCGENGQTACRVQAWSAASLLVALSKKD